MLLSEERVRKVLAEEGQDEGLADHWPWAIRWRPEWDKVGFLNISPLSKAAKDAIEVYLAKRAAVGEAWVFPATEDPGDPLGKLMASYYLRRAEELAGLTHQKRGGWHAFRRAWATRRKHLPVQDVMRAGG